MASQYHLLYDIIKMSEYCVDKLEGRIKELEEEVQLNDTIVSYMPPLAGQAVKRELQVESVTILQEILHLKFMKYQWKNLYDLARGQHQMISSLLT